MCSDDSAAMPPIALQTAAARTLQMRAAVEQNGKSGGAMGVCLILIITVSKMRLSCCNATLLSATV